MSQEFTIALITLAGVFITTSGGIIVAVLNASKKTEENFKQVREDIQGIDEKVDKVDRELKSHVKSDEYRNANDAKRRFLRFYEEERHGHEHSRDHWLDALDDCSIYKNQRDSDPNFPNHKGTIAMEYLEKTFAVLDESDNFLK